MKQKLAYCLCLMLFAISGFAQQLGDTSFVLQIKQPAFETGKGPVVKIDEAHHNFHTMSGRYFAFAEVLRQDGYRVEAGTSEFTPDSLRTCGILVISNALNERNIEDWSLPTPSAFTDQEIESVRKWVEGGGSLFLIADHMPFAGAAAKLAAVFGFEFKNGFALSPSKEGPDIFRRSDESLRPHAITDGKEPAERIDSVTTFTGQAFSANREHEPIIVFSSDYILLLPEAAWEFEEKADTISIAGMMQAAAMYYGKGRIFVSGEAAMFSSQTAPGGIKFGFSSPAAPQNLRYLRNVMSWLSGRLD